MILDWNSKRLFVLTNNLTIQINCQNFRFFIIDVEHCLQKSYLNLKKKKKNNHAKFIYLNINLPYYYKFINYLLNNFRHHHRLHYNHQYHNHSYLDHQYLYHQKNLIKNVLSFLLQNYHLTMIIIIPIPLLL